MNNLSAHKGERVKELIEDKGCEIFYLPSYWPDLNPIEEAFSKIKGILRQDRSPRQGGSGGSAGRGPQCGKCSGRPGFLRALWLL